MNTEINPIWREREKDIIIHNEKMNIIESCITRHAEKTPNKLAFLFEQKNKTTKYTYKELEQETNKFANLLKKQAKPNSRIFIFLPKIPELYISFLASIKSGNISAPLFEAFQSEGLELRLERGDANVLITNKELSERLKHKDKFKHMKLIIIDDENFKKQLNSQSAEFKTILKSQKSKVSDDSQNCQAILKSRKDTAVLMFTSSTAGTPVAGIQIPHQALIQQHYTAKLVLDLKPEDNYFCSAHPGWVTGTVYGIIAPLSIGCSNFIYTPHFEANKWINFIKKHKISVMYTAPTALRLLKPIIKKSDLTYLRNLCSVGEALTKTLFNQYKKLRIKINDTYWQTETGAIVIANYKGLKKKIGSLGKAIPGITAIIKQRTITLKPDFPSIMTGIYKHEQMYKQYFKDNWFTTNDLAKLDKQGYFFFESRKDDIIKVSGERISPIEIENELEKHSAVKEAAVIGIPDKIKGNILKAFIVLNKPEQATEQLKEELSLFVKRDYAGHSYPKIIEFVKSLPKTNSGKIIRAKLREKNEI